MRRQRKSRRFRGAGSTRRKTLRPPPRLSPRNRQGAANTGEAASATLDADGKYTLKLTTTGPHCVVVTPSDVKYPAKPGEEYPCDLAPQERDLKAGENKDVDIELKPRPKPR